jgi:hypothetical protein
VILEGVLNHQCNFAQLAHVPRILQLIRMTHVVFDAYLVGEEAGVEGV